MCFIFNTDLNDFVLSSNGELTFTELRTTQCINLTVVNDDVQEMNETVMITPSPVNPLDTVVGGGYNVSIMDDGDGNNY